MAGQPLYNAYPTKNKPPSLDTYGSPGAPIIQTYEETLHLPNDNSYPNALHVITAFPGDTNDTSDEDLNIDNDPDKQLDKYGSPLAPAIGDLSLVNFISDKPATKYANDGSEIFHDDIGQTMADFHAAEEFSISMDKPYKVNDKVINLKSDVVPEDQNILQNPSSDFPDQNNPEQV